jgi:predicted glycoside hydrolase/deacetylase ChbG (UPF0249 family)
MRVVYDDDDLIEIEICPSVKGWTAAARVYASAQQTAESARPLREWVSRPVQPFALDIGGVNGVNGWACLRFYIIDKSGHVTCHLQLASMVLDEPQEEDTWRLSLEMRTEPALIDSFVQELESMAADRAGEAVLRGVLR